MSTESLDLFMTKKDKASRLVQELRRTEDGIRGTMGWIEGRVKPDVYDKMRTVIVQSVRYGQMLNSLEGEAFKAGLEKELCD